MPLPRLLYAQVVKQYRRKRVVGVHHRVVFGTLEAVEHVLAACGWKINTSFIERLNLYRKAQPRHSPACGGSRASGQYAVPGRSRLTASTGIVPRLLQLRAGAWQ